MKSSSHFTFRSDCLMKIYRIRFRTLESVEDPYVISIDVGMWRCLRDKIPCEEFNKGNVDEAIYEQISALDVGNLLTIITDRPVRGVTVYAHEAMKNDVRVPVQRMLTPL